MKIKEISNDPRFSKALAGLTASLLLISDILFESFQKHHNANYVSKNTSPPSYVGDLNNNGQADVVRYYVAGERQVHILLREPTEQEKNFYRENNN